MCECIDIIIKKLQHYDLIKYCMTVLDINRIIGIVVIALQCYCFAHCLFIIFKFVVWIKWCKLIYQL